MPTVASNQNSIHQASAGQFIPAKVVDVVLDMNFPDIEKIGGWDALGTILYIKVSDIITDPEIEYKRNQQTLIAANSLARPLFSNQKYYPLKGEIVLLFSTTGREIITDTKETYYLNNINIWNHPHHNALPNPDTYNGTHPKDNNDKTKNDYLKSIGGLVRQVQDGDTEIPLGAYFDERLDTKPLLPFEGDYILEGRFGNSIRFGATAPGPNNWSTVGKTGDPITILRNGQSDELDKKGWEPTTEDVNRDPSSIYLTSTQKLDKFVPAALNWQSWGAKPTVIEDPIEALSTPVLEEYVAPLPPEDITDALIEAAPTGSVDIVAEEIIAEDNIKIKDSPEKEQDELSLYDELIESGDFDEDDFEEGIIAELGIYRLEVGNSDIKHEENNTQGIDVIVNPTVDTTINTDNLPAPAGAVIKNQTERQLIITLMGFLITEGKFSPEEAAGICGNVKSESGFKCWNVEDWCANVKPTGMGSDRWDKGKAQKGNYAIDGKRGWFSGIGLCQWTWGRRYDMEKYCGEWLTKEGITAPKMLKNKFLDTNPALHKGDTTYFKDGAGANLEEYMKTIPKLFEAQCSFLAHEFKTKYKGVIAIMRGGPAKGNTKTLMDNEVFINHTNRIVNKTISGYAECVVCNFEVPGDVGNVRIKSKLTGKEGAKKIKAYKAMVAKRSKNAADCLATWKSK
jgi:hypothetical protein